MTLPRYEFEYAPGLHINYEIRGHGSRPALLLHGFGASLETWRDIESYLEPHLLLYLVDMKGFGLSSKPDDLKYSIDDQASVIVSLIERLDLTGFCLIGHSLGGAVAVASYAKLAAQCGRIQSLILIGSPATVQRLPFFIWPLRVPVLSDALWLAPARARVRTILRRILYDPGLVTEDRVQRYTKFVDSPESRRALAATARQIVPEDPGHMLAALTGIRVPTLIIRGDRDRVVPAWQGEILKRVVPGSELAVIPECGHIPQEERPAETAGAILDFLAGGSTPSGPPPLPSE